MSGSGSLAEHLAYATEFTFDALTEFDDNWGTWQVKVAYRGRGTWAILHGPWCLNRDGDWEYESSPGSRSAEFKDRCRFDLDTALRRAQEVLPSIEVNGKTAADWVKSLAASGGLS